MGEWKETETETETEVVRDGRGRKSLYHQKRKGLRKEARAETVLGLQKGKGQGHLPDAVC